MKGWLYILQCSDGSYYTGSTYDLDMRLLQHECGLAAPYTRERLPVTLVYAEEYAHIQDAFAREQQVKDWSHRKKEALISGTPELRPAFPMGYRPLTPEDAQMPTGFVTANPAALVPDETRRPGTAATDDRPIPTPPKPN